jgi:hypothetical protein
VTLWPSAPVGGQGGSCTARRGRPGGGGSSRRRGPRRGRSASACSRRRRGSSGRGRRPPCRGLAGRVAAGIGPTGRWPWCVRRPLLPPRAQSAATSNPCECDPSGACRPTRSGPGTSRPRRRGGGGWEAGHIWPDLGRQQLGWEAGHIWPDLGRQQLGGPAVDPGIVSSSSSWREKGRSVPQPWPTGSRPSR